MTPLRDPEFIFGTWSKLTRGSHVTLFPTVINLLNIAHTKGLQPPPPPYSWVKERAQLTGKASEKHHFVIVNLFYS